MSDTPSPQNPLSGKLMFYTNPQPLNRQQHGDLGLKRIDNPLIFLKDTHLTPLMVPEFIAAAICYPIIFMGAPRRPAAVLGVVAGQNMFFEADGKFAADAYLPAYVRRYPFAFANNEQEQQLILIIDRDAEVISDSPDLPFFEGDQPTAAVTESMNFCEEFERQRLLTEAFCNEMEELDLFEQRQATHTPRNPDGTMGEPQIVATFFAISEEKLNQLSAEQLTKLRESGALRCIYAHLISLVGWERLIARHIISLGGVPAAGTA